MDDIQGNIAIIAGSGRLPITIFNHLSEKKTAPFLILIKENADPYLYQFRHKEIDVTEFANLLKTLKQQDIKNIILAGGIKSRPQLKSLHFDLPTLYFLPRLIFALRRGDDALLKAFIKALEAYQYHVIGGQNFLPDLLAPKCSLLTRTKPKTIDHINIKLAFQAAKLLGKLDIGQGAVAVAGRVVAVEGAEGTDNLLKRIEFMRLEKRIPEKGGVLVKCVKPQQDLRVDLPTIGVDTIKKAFDCGLSGVAIEAEYSIILEPQKTIDCANEKGLFLQTINQNEVLNYEKD